MLHQYLGSVILMTLLWCYFKIEVILRELFGATWQRWILNPLEENVWENLSVIPYIAVNAKKQVLPGDIKTNIPFNYEEGESEKLISTARSMVTLDPLTSKYLIDPKVPPWAGIHALLSDKQLSLKNVGFLPIIPNPVTRHDTVFTCLRNFSSICSNLDQEVLPVACDEGVYQYVVDIYLCNPDIFHDIFPM